MRIGKIAVYLVLFVAVFAGVNRLVQPYLPKTDYGCGNSCSDSFVAQVDNRATGTFENKTVIPPSIDTAAEIHPNVLGAESNAAEKHIYVDLTKQTLTAYEGKKLFMETKVSTGKWHPTPDGDFKIWIKIRATRMSGGEGADYYNLPNVPYVMYFSNDQVPESAGFSLHGAYWHNNFGHPMSHGCVNMRQVDAEKLYDWATPVTTGLSTRASADNPGTLITISGEAPL